MWDLVQPPEAQACFWSQGAPQHPRRVDFPPIWLLTDLRPAPDRRPTPAVSRIMRPAVNFHPQSCDRGVCFAISEGADDLARTAPPAWSFSKLWRGKFVRSCCIGGGLLVVKWSERPQRGEDCRTRIATAWSLTDFTLFLQLSSGSCTAGVMPTSVTHPG